MQHLFSAAETAHAAQRNREAIGYLLDILRIHDAHCPKAYYKLAVIYWSASNDAFSVRYCSLAARICRLHIDFERTNGTYEELMKKRGYSFEYWYYIFIGLIADFSSRLEAASTSYKLALELVNSKNIPDTGYEALLNLGIVEMNNNDLEEAIKLFYKAYDVETSPYYRSTCLNNIGQMYAFIIC
jgi:tetratricopeptide (TPR) repeat protein